MDAPLNKDLVYFIWDTMIGYNDEKIERTEFVGSEGTYIFSDKKSIDIRVPVKGRPMIEDKKMPKKDDEQEFIYYQIASGPKHERLNLIINIPTMDRDLVDIEDRNKVDRVIKVPTDVLIDDDYDYERQYIYIKAPTIKNDANMFTNDKDVLIDDKNEATNSLVEECESIIKIKVHDKKKSFELQVFKKVGQEWSLISKKVEQWTHYQSISILGIKFLYNNDIAIF